MSVKSERRAWYAANVEPMTSADRASQEFAAWRDRANVYMRAACKPGSVELREDFASELADVAAVKAELAGDPVAPVRVAPVRIASAAAPSSGDRAEYDSFIHGQLLAFGDYTGAAGGYSDDVWERGVTGREFGKGPVLHAWKHLNADAREAIDAGVMRWVTFAEFKLERAALRAAEAAEIAAHDAPQDCADCASAHLAECVCSALVWAA